MKKFFMVWAGICLVAAVATGCTESSTTSEETAAGTTSIATTSAPTTETTDATSPAPAAGAAKITIANMGFGEPITVSPGAQVSVTNDDSVEHSVTSQTAGQFDVHVDGNEDGTFTAPSEPGEYPFYCVYHPSMKGTLIVQ